MTLLIGNSKKVSLNSSDGFTLLEILLSVFILSVGIVAVYQPLLACLSTLNYAEERLEANNLLSKEIWVLESKMKLSDLTGLTSDDTLIGSDRIYRYQASSQPLSRDQQLFKTKVEIAWQDAGRAKRIAREICLLLPVKKIASS